MFLAEAWLSTRVHFRCREIADRFRMPRRPRSGRTRASRRAGKPPQRDPCNSAWASAQEESTCRAGITPTRFRRRAFALGRYYPIDGACFCVGAAITSFTQPGPLPLLHVAIRRSASRFFGRAKAPPAGLLRMARAAGRRCRLPAIIASRHQLLARLPAAHADAADAAR